MLLQPCLANNWASALMQRGRKIVKIRGAKICHAYVLHLSSWKDSLNGIMKIPYYSTCMYMTIYRYIIIILIIKPNYPVCTEK